MRMRDRLLASTGILLILAALPAIAQTATSTTEEETDDEEVVVVQSTASKGTVLQTLKVSAGAEATVGTQLIARTFEQLERMQPTDIQEIFAGDPSVAIGGAIASTQKIFVNGIEETNLAVTVDGSRQNNKVFHHNGTYLLDPALLKAVAVQPGVAPADAGPAALAGSIGFETVDATDLLDPGKDFGGFVTAMWDSNSRTYKTGLALYGIAEGLEYLGYVNYANGGDYTAGNGQVMPGTGTNLLSGLGKLAYEVDRHRFELSHEQVKDSAPRPYRANFYFRRGLEPTLRNYELNRQNTVFQYTMTEADGWLDPTVLLAYSKTSIDTLYSDRFTGATAQTLGTTASLNGKAENRFNFGLGSVTAGVDFYNDAASLDDLSINSFPVEKAANVGGYVQARLEPEDYYRLSFGGRLDHQSFTGVNGQRFEHSGISSNISGEYDIVPEFLTLKGGAAQVWGGIPLAENFVQNAAWTYGANGPDPVSSLTYSTGLVARFEAVTLEASLFNTNIRNARFPLYGGQPNRSFDLDTWGYELGGRYEGDVGFIGAKYTNVFSNVDGVPTDTEVGRYLTTPVGEVIMLSAGYSFPDLGLTLGGDAEFALENTRTLTRHPTDPATAKKPLPGYQVFNAFAEYQPIDNENLSVRFEVRNIFDTAYTSRASYGQDFDGTTPHLEPGRTFRVSTKLKF